MFLTIVGFLVLIIGLVFISFAYVLLAVDGLGRWNMGGVENSTLQKVGILLGGVLLFLAWRALFHNAPFSINITG